MTRWVECVPNFSEGRRPEVIAAIQQVIADCRGVHILDVSSDESHNRTVITYIVRVDDALDAAFAGIAKSLELIDLNNHSGVHPRIGATDVFPFVPILGSSMEECVALARGLGQRLGSELKVPVFMYERAATRPERRNLAFVRRGGLGALQREMSAGAPREPDFGPASPHPTFGAIAVGARPLLVAFNVYLGNAVNLTVARKVARNIRESSGGLPGVKAIPLLVDGQAQVSMNLVDLPRISVLSAFEAVKAAAAAEGVEVTWSEIVGLVPESALPENAAERLQLPRFSSAQLLERRLEDVLPGLASVASLHQSIAAPTPAHGGGFVTAHAAMLAASLVQMLAGLTARAKRDGSVRAQMQSAEREAALLAEQLPQLGKEDAMCYEALAAALRLKETSPEMAAERSRAVNQSAVAATEVPLKLSRASARIAQLLSLAAEQCSSNALPDCAVAAMLCETACRGSYYNVQANIALLRDGAHGSSMLREATGLLQVAVDVSAGIRGATENALAGTRAPD